MTSLTRFPRFLIWIASAVLVRAEDVALYATPAADHQPISYVSATSSAVEKATPVLEAEKKAQGWFWAEYSGAFDGYVEARDLDDSRHPKMGAIVYVEPRGDAPIITTIESGDRGAAVEPSNRGGFSRVSLNKRVGVYFNRGAGYSPPPAPRPTPRAQASTVAPTPTPTPRVQPAPVIATPPPAAKPVESAPPATTPPRAQVRPAPAPAPTPAPVPAPAAPREASNPPRELPPRGLPPPVTVSKHPVAAPTTIIDNSITLRGILAQSKRQWLIVNPPQPFVLRDVDGERIAWVDLSEAVFARPLPDLLGHEVILYGEWKQVDGQTEMVLLTRHVRPAL